MRQTCATSLVSVFTLIVALLTSEATAETLKFKASLAGSKEVPPNDSAGEATGDVTLDTDSKRLTWTVASSGLSGDATAAHFHGPAAPGENAGPVVDISGAIKSGSAEITDKQIADLQAGKWYLNIHTEKFPDGEIRGQVEKGQ